MSRTVLFVDDNPVILKTIQAAFANENYEVLLASSGKEGLLFVEEHHPNIIVTTPIRFKYYGRAIRTKIWPSINCRINCKLFYI